MKVSVVVVPAASTQKPTEHVVEIQGDTANVRDVLKNAQIEPKGFKITVAGISKPGLDSVVKDGDRIVLTEKARGS